MRIKIRMTMILVIIRRIIKVLFQGNRDRGADKAMVVVVVAAAAAAAARSTTTKRIATRKRRDFPFEESYQTASNLQGKETTTKVTS